MFGFEGTKVYFEREQFSVLFFVWYIKIKFHKFFQKTVPFSVKYDIISVCYYYKSEVTRWIRKFCLRTEPMS